MKSNSNNIKVRFPPSPTGEWHFGNVRTFVFNYLFAKHNNGEIVMRFEDTDQARNKEGADKMQLEILSQLGMSFDEGPYYQSKRSEIYISELKRLINEGKAYEAEENQQKTGKVIRIKNPTRLITWNDLVKGEISISTDSFKDSEGRQDFVIARSIDDPLYHFAVVVDDYKMGITHVLRGEDHVTSTPRQIVIFDALEATTPQFGHFPTILGENKKKLGKRNGAIPVREYLEKTYLPDALLNTIALLGWNPGTEQEIFTKEQLIELFSLEKVQTHPAIFTGEKLDWINREHIKMLPDEKVKEEILARLPEKIRNSKKNDSVVAMLRERISKWQDVNQIIESGELEFIYNEPIIDNKDDLICPEKLRKDLSVDSSTISKHLAVIIELLQQSEEFSADSIKSLLWDYATKNGRGVVLWAMRFALSGKEKSPDPFIIASIIGKDESIKRLKNALEI